MPKLIVFLGNPGSQYRGTRHNTGFSVCLKMKEENYISGSWQEKFHSLYCKEGDRIYLMPQTYMNLSGNAVQEAAKFYNLKPEDVIVVHDDIELKSGEVRLQTGGGMGGHNGLRSIKQNLGTENFQRLRIGVGRPEDSNSKMDVATWVTSHFSEMEERILETSLQKAIEIILHA